MQALRRRLHTGNFQILAVNLGEDQLTIREFLERNRIEAGFPVLLARDEGIMEQWRITALPMSYIVDKRGRWIYQALGPRDFNHEHIVGRVRELVTEGAE